METAIEDAGLDRGPTLTSSWDAACGALTQSLLLTRTGPRAQDLDFEQLLEPPAPGQDLVSLKSSLSPRDENPCFIYLKCGPNGGEEILSVGVLSSARNMEVYLGEEYCGTSRGKNVCTVLDDSEHEKILLYKKYLKLESPTHACKIKLLSFGEKQCVLISDVSTWVAAEIVTSHTSKLQVNLLSKFLLIAKSCYEQRNFATAMQILGGLEHLAVRQSPAWRILPAKIAEVMEELKAVEVFLKSDSLCLMEGRRFRAQPTLPSAHLLAMHIQQLETGGFTMTNGAHRWSKLRNIAKVASQVHAFQENPYTFSPDPKLQAHLKQRIARFSGADVSILAADNRANFHQIPGEKHSRKIQDKLRRMKATFQ